MHQGCELIVNGGEILLKHRRANLTPLHKKFMSEKKYMTGDNLPLVILLHHNIAFIISKGNMVLQAESCY
jgi:hypothetical protein